MTQLSPPLTSLLAPFGPCFRAEVFATFCQLTAGWIVCTARRTISEVWQATGLSGLVHHDTAYSLFASAVWTWDAVCKVLLLAIVRTFVPQGTITLVVDDTLSHKRGKHVAFAGFFLDAVTSSKRRKNFRFGLNWVVLCIVVRLPWRTDRVFALPVLWRVYRKAGTPGHATRTQLAKDMAQLVCKWLPTQQVRLVCDVAYMNKVLLKDRPQNLHVVGQVRLNCALYTAPPPRQPGQKGRPRKRGDRIDSPTAMLADTTKHKATAVKVGVGKAQKSVQVQEAIGVQWYGGAGEQLLKVITVHDERGTWKDSALLSTDTTMSAEDVIAWYGCRWSIEVTFHDCKQYLGLHEPRVRTASSVERAHGMAYFMYSLVVLWYAQAGEDTAKPQRDRPWYTTKAAHTFTDMLGALRLAVWQDRISGLSDDANEQQKALQMLLNRLAQVG